MPDLTNRTDWEAQLARALSKLSQQQLKKLTDALGDPPDLNKVTPEFWNEFSTAYRGELFPILENVFLDSAQQMLGTTSIGVDWALVNTQAATWAEQYTYDLVRGITDNTRSALQSKVGAYFRNGLTIGDLKDSLQNLFGPVRAEMIASTEITRAAFSGEHAIVQGIQQQGITMIARWQTNNDETVCPRCGPRNGKLHGDGWWDYPPIHPRDRCWVNWEFPK